MRTLFLFLVLSAGAFAGEDRMVDLLESDKVVPNGDLNETEVLLHFTFDGIPEGSKGKIVYSIGINEQDFDLSDETLTIDAVEGLHYVQFYYNSQFMEVDGYISVLGQHEYYYSITFREAYEQIQTRKPVIYLYPTEQTEVEVQLEIENGETPFYYPAYTDGWHVTAYPNGTIEMNSEQYRYLFWEALQSDHVSTTDIESGYILENTEVVAFLEDKLTQIGFNSVEQADFITYWAPLLAKNELSYIRFEWNEDCDKFAALKITPQPDEIFRLYIFAAPISTEFAITPQVLPQFNRSGFSVLEWGGQITDKTLEPTL